MRSAAGEHAQAFLQATGEPWWEGVRIKDVRGTPLTPGGRARLTLFEQVEGAGRPHPRLQVSMPPAKDPAPPAVLFQPPEEPPTSAAAFEQVLRAATEGARDLLRAADLPEDDAEGSPRLRQNTIRGQRTRRFFDEAGLWLEQLLATGTLPDTEATGCWYALRTRRDLAFVGPIAFDDADTGTYHSYRHDDPFVHYLEALIGQLPEEGTEALVLLDADQRQSVRRQRQQARNHLDHLMRRKYAHDGVIETDIERSVGGFLIDRQTRMVVSETPGSAGSLVPAYELLQRWGFGDAEAWERAKGRLGELRERALS